MHGQVFLTMRDSFGIFGSAKHSIKCDLLVELPLGSMINISLPGLYLLTISFIFELCHEKTNNVISGQVRHKSSCTDTEEG